MVGIVDLQSYRHIFFLIITNEVRVISTKYDFIINVTAMPGEMISLLSYNKALFFSGTGNL